MSPLLDDLDHEVPLPRPARRVVSLVPSLTEALATSAPGVLVGATDWCTHPADLDVARVRGTKNPNLDAIAKLEPDLVIANKEENRELDVRRLRERGIAVWVTVTESVPQALDSMERLFAEALALDVPDWLVEARRLWGREVPEAVATAAVAIWRDPWMVVGSHTFTGDVMRRLGLVNVYDDHADRYPSVTVADIEGRTPDLVLLPDEPYVFTADDGPEAFADATTRLVSGRLLTWYGPSLVEAHTELGRLC
ncbi:helical backbone metal receptor [Nocardioides sp. Root151]|uniref:helical backbone metal receptor n=1 Tax=Nocardioides sp. Root151 TaxID=1736475 RepID=UPI000702B50D|nr:helical backbone metal receptor [Nocardioides sp. Root151]KQZ70196.1 ABC transporter substrate-binding protein [Nocardioides sp. Root151]